MSEGLNVLFIEDDPPVRQATAQSLELAGFNVQAFGSAEEAVGKIDANFPGVVVSDLRLPGASGLDVLTHCQSFGTGIPVVLVTGHGDMTARRVTAQLMSCSDPTVDGVGQYRAQRSGRLVGQWLGRCQL